MNITNTHPTHIRTRGRVQARTRVAALLAAVVSTVAIVGGSLVATATPSSAAAGGTNVCDSFTAVLNIDPVTFVATAIGTFSGCHEHGSGTSVEVISPDQDPTAPTLVTIHWATGNARSEEIVTATPRKTVDPQCPAPYTDATIDVYSTVVHGAYTGSSSQGVQCLDFHHFPPSGVGIGTPLTFR